MITAIIFFAHFIFTLIIFTKKWQEEGISSAWMNVGLIVILFAVGWTVTGMIAKILMEQEGIGIHFDRDTFSLTLLTIMEVFFYRFYYRDTVTEDGKEIQ
jgi:formate hydrogenlyase subunit 3/multisubunit Na+/H+ antiporter MnhD subunit